MESISWMKDIPNHWEERRIGALFTDQVFANSDFAYKHAFKFNYGTLVPKNEIGDEEEFRETYIKYSVLKKNDIQYLHIPARFSPKLQYFEKPGCVRL